MFETPYDGSPYLEEPPHSCEAASPPSLLGKPVGADELTWSAPRWGRVLMRGPQTLGGLNIHHRPAGAWPLQVIRLDVDTYRAYLRRSIELTLGGPLRHDSA